MDRGAWQATLHGVSKSQARLRRLSKHDHEEVASSVEGGIRRAMKSDQELNPSHRFTGTVEEEGGSLFSLFTSVSTKVFAEKTAGEAA